MLAVLKTVTIVLKITQCALGFQDFQPEVGMV